MGKTFHVRTSEGLVEVIAAHAAVESGCLVFLGSDGKFISAIAAGSWISCSIVETPPRS